MEVNSTRTSKFNNIIKILVCLVLVSAIFTGGLMARHTSSSSGSDSARVAEFEVTMSPLSSENMILNGVEATNNQVNGIYSFNVSCISETAVRYDIVVRFKNTQQYGVDAPPVGLSINIDQQTPQITNGNVSEFHFSGGVFSPNDPIQQQHTLTIVGDLAQLTADSNYTVTVDVVATQID